MRVGRQAGRGTPRPAVRTGIERWTLVPGAADAVWARVTSPAGINDELRPLLRMSVPRSLRGVGIGDLVEGRPVGRSWFLLLGVVPVGYDEITLERIDPPKLFREHSQVTHFADWVHQRQVVPVGDRVSLVWDEVSWLGKGRAARSPIRRALQRRVLGLLFARRHRRLVAHFRRLVTPAELGSLAPGISPAPASRSSSGPGISVAPVLSVVQAVAGSMTAISRRRLRRPR